MAETIAKTIRRKWQGLKRIRQSWASPDVPCQPREPEYRITGDTDYQYLVIPHAASFDIGWLYVIDGRGNMLWRKELPGYGYSFRQIRYPDGTVRYAYQQAERATPGAYFSLEEAHLVLMDEKMNVIRDNIRLLRGGSIRTRSFPCENHEYVVLGDDHYILTAEKNGVVRNIPGFENTPVRVFNPIIQEQKNGKVLWQFEAKDHPELYQASVASIAWANYAGRRTLYGTAADYAHVNAVAIAPDGNILVSFRNIGLVMIEKATNKILWVMGRGRNDIRGLKEEQTALYQHQARYLQDGSFIVFDNYGCPENRSRICRYWIDGRQLVRYEEYLTEQPRSACMGGAQFLHDQTFLICYGGMQKDLERGFYSADPAFEVYDFEKKKTLAAFSFKEKYDCYQVECVRDFSPPSAR